MCQVVDKTRMKMERKLNMLVLVEETCQACLVLGWNGAVKYFHPFLKSGVFFAIFN